MPRKKVAKTKKQENKDALAKLFPTSVEIMEQVLNDNLKHKTGRKMNVTGKMRLDVALRIVDQVVGRAPQSLTSNAGDDIPPITTLEVVKTYINPEAAVDNADGGDQELVPAEEFEQDKDPDRAGWLRQVEEEALAQADDMDWISDLVESVEPE